MIDIESKVSQVVVAVRLKPTQDKPTVSISKDNLLQL